MPSNVLSRKTVREALATLIDAAFNSDWDVFNYKTTKFSGKARNIVVTSAGSRRTVMGAKDTESDASFRFRIFVFVLFSVQPVQATNSPTAGSNKTINIPDTTNFINGNTIRVEDDSSAEDAVINQAIVTDTSIRVATLVNSYTTPRVYAWTPHNSDDQLDTAEKTLADVANDNQSGTYWNKLAVEGETDPDLIVDEGGQTFRREIIVWRTDKYT